MRVVCWVVLSVVCALSVAACDAEPETKGPPVVYTESNDAEMNAAVQKARAELAAFESALRAPKPTQTGFGVKVALPHAAGVEHVWLGNPRMEADSVVGVVEDAPMYATQTTKGSLVRVDRAAISDWMYLENGKLRGGYTMRIAIDRLPAAQRDEQRRSFGIE